MAKRISIEKSVKMAIRRPAQSHTLLAKTLAAVINGETWIDRKMKKKFCALLMCNLIDRSIEQEVDTSFLKKIKSIPLTSGIRLLKRTPEQGLKVLVALVSIELRNQQQLNENEQVAFFKELFDYFFPPQTEGTHKDHLIHFSVIQKELRKRNKNISK